MIALVALVALAAAAQAGPSEDYDRDGIANTNDDCPTDAGNAANAGCPGTARAIAAPPRRTPSLAEVRGSIIVLAQPIQFESGSARLARGMDALMDAIAEAIGTVPPEREVVVRGHTDDRGGRKSNLTLSKRRAETVAGALARRGIEAPRLSPDGAGPDVPIADNRTAEGRAKNRRVEFVIAAPKTE